MNIKAILYNQRTLFIFIAIFSCFSIYAQDNKAKDVRYKVFASKLKCDQAKWDIYANEINENILTNLKNTKRVNVYSKGSSATATEANDDANVKLLEAGSNDWSWGLEEFGKPNYTLGGVVNNVKFIGLGIKGYQAVVSFTIQITDPTSGDIVEQLEFKGEKAKPEISMSSAFPAALKMTNEAQIAFFESIFNLRTTILKIDNSSKTAAKTLTIIAGKNSGLKGKEQFIVKQVEEVEGFPVETVIGTIKVKSIGASTTQCQVTKGGKGILSLFDKANRESLICELKVKK